MLEVNILSMEKKKIENPSMEKVNDIEEQHHHVDLENKLSLGDQSYNPTNKDSRDVNVKLEDKYRESSKDRAIDFNNCKFIEAHIVESEEVYERIKRMFEANDDEESSDDDGSDDFADDESVVSAADSGDVLSDWDDVDDTDEEFAKWLVARKEYLVEKNGSLKKMMKA